MLKLILFILTLSGLMACQADKPSPGSSADKPFTPTGTMADLVYNPIREDGSIDSSFLPIIQWEQDTLFQFGEVNEGDVVTTAFAFTNIGTAPLLITSASSSCGCTIPEWPKTPIQPDSSGTIQVKFNTLDRTGAQTKEVYIFANTIPNRTSLYLKGRVEPNK